MERLDFHLFWDSSQNVYSEVAFLRGKLVTKGTETIELAFVFDKARVGPLKCLKILKLELLAALLASLLRQEVESAVSLIIERCFFWTDNTTVQQWLHSLEIQPTFVANCFTETLELKTVDEWNHVPTGDITADACTCGLSAIALFESSWLKGPDFLRSRNRPFILCSDVNKKIKSKKLAPDEENDS